MPGLSDEADAVEFFPASALPTNTVPKQVERIMDAVARGPGPVLKVQAGPSVREQFGLGPGSTD